MSYSFSVTAASKDEAKAKIKAEWDRIVEAQPVHSADRASAEAAAGAFVDALADPSEGQVIKVDAYGSLGWRGIDPDVEFTSANMSVTATLATAAA